LREGPERAAATAYHASGEQVAMVRRLLASEAAIRTDVHLVKYTLATLDTARLDRGGAPLYHAAAAYLAALWMREVPEDALSENLHQPPGTF